MKYILVAAFSLFVLASNAQLIKDPTTWSYTVKKLSANKYELHFHVALQPTWHVYAMAPGGDGSLIPPSFTFDAAPGVTLSGKVHEVGKPQTEKMEGIDGAVHFYKNSADYVQLVTAAKIATITGKLEYQVCSDKMCLPPKKKDFSFTVN